MIELQAPLRMHFFYDCCRGFVESTAGTLLQECNSLEQCIRAGARK
jgi:hypothetical protein